MSIQEGISLVDEPTANAYAGDHAAVELVQVNLFMQLHSPNTSAVTESYTLPDALHRALNGGRLPTAPTKVYGMKVVGRTRVLGMTRPKHVSPNAPARLPNGLVHHAITVQVKRNL